MTIIAAGKTYSELIEALRARKDARGLSNNDLDALSGLPTGYAGKIFGAAQVRALGPLSFDNFLAALALQFQLVHDPEADERIARLSEKRQPMRKGVPQGKQRNRSLKDSLRRQAIRHGRAGGKKSAELRMQKPFEHRSEAARKSAIAGWKKRREIGAQIERKLEQKVRHGSRN